MATCTLVPSPAPLGTGGGRFTGSAPPHQSSDSHFDRVLKGWNSSFHLSLEASFSLLSCWRDKQTLNGQMSSSVSSECSSFRSSAIFSLNLLPFFPFQRLRCGTVNEREFFLQLFTCFSPFPLLSSPPFFSSFLEASLPCPDSKNAPPCLFCPDLLQLLCSFQLLLVCFFQLLFAV